MSDFMESIFQSVDILIDRRLDDLSYDTTVICRIIDVSESKNGKYLVSDGSISYPAYSENPDYKIGESVRVSIPNNDYAQRKFILGKYGEEEDSLPITYVSSIDNVVNISGNLANNIQDKEFGIAANGFTKKKIIWNCGFTSGEFENLQTAGIYNTIILKADFKTPLLIDYNLLEGTYGLRIDLLIRPSVDSVGRIRRSAELSSSEMFGDPYNFPIFSTQSKTFSFSIAGGIIEGIELSLYQNGDFRDSKQGYIKSMSDDIYHILVSNIVIGLGSDIVDVEDNIVKLYSSNSLSYNYNPDTDATNLKNIGLLWYNKDEFNSYLGFTDGLYDPDYDELEYLKESNTDSRLVAQQGREGIPPDEKGLRIAADLEEITHLSDKAIKLINQDLILALRNFNEEIKVIYPASGASTDTTINKLINPTLTNKTKEIQTLMNTISEFHLKSLKVISDTGTGNGADDFTLTVVNNNSLSLIKTKLMDIINIVTSEEENIRNYIINRSLNGYYGIIDNHKPKIARVINSINDILEIFPPLLTDEEIYNYYSHIGTYFTPYSEKDLSSYHNKYCIYWYHYEKGYKLSPTEEKYQFMPENWRQLKFFEADGVTEIRNIGIPRYSEGMEFNTNKNDEIINLKSPLPGDQMITQHMKHDLPEEKYVAIVFHNHNMYKSEELIFTNSQPIPDKLTLDKGDCLTFSHEDNSYDSYNIYDESNYLRDASDESKLREIRCHYEGVSLLEDDVFPDAGIYWYIPDHASMLTYDKEELLARGFVTDIDIEEDKKPNYTRPGFVCFYKQITAEKIEGDPPIYNYVKEVDIDPREEYVYKQQIDSRSFWYKIQPYYESATTQNYIICKVIPSGEVDAVETKIFFNFGIAGNSGTKYTLSIVNSTSQCAVQDSKPLYLSVDLRDASNNKLDIDLNDSKKIKITWPYKFGGESNIGATVRSGSSNELEVNGTDCGIISIELKNQSVSDKRKINLKQIYAIPWSAGDFYFSGTTRIIYNGMGTLDKGSSFSLPYKLFDMHTNEEITVSKWEISYHQSRGTSISSANLYNSYMPTISPDGLLQPAPLYLDGIESQCYAMVVAKDVNNNDMWQQPIIIMQNRYGSPFLNDWDGTFKIDNDNGTIMSTMVGAGRKTVNNTFEGVLMGDVQAVSAVNKSGIGLYGFHDGAQSFGLNIDGTAFFGKAGMGRIKIDGNKSTIESAGYKENKQGMKIDLEQGVIDIISQKDKSQVTMSIKSPYLTITASEGDTIMEVGKDDYFLQSANFDGDKDDEGSTGLRIDLVEGEVIGHELYIQSDHVVIDSRESASTYLQVYGDGDTWLMSIGETSFIQSANYISSNGSSGTFIDLNGGWIYSNQFDFITEQIYMSYENGFWYNDANMYCGMDTGQSLAFGGDGWGSLNNLVFRAGSGFAVDMAGTMYAAGAKIGGTLMAAGGTFQGDLNAAGGTFQGDLNAAGGTFQGDLNAAGGTFKGTVTAEGAVFGSIEEATGQYGGGTGQSINAKTGSYVGGWTITNTEIKSNSGQTILKNDGTITAAGGNFKLDESGNVTITGTITATAGEIGKCTIDSNGNLRVKNLNVESINMTKVKTNNDNSIFSDTGSGGTEEIKISINDGNSAYFIMNSNSCALYGPNAMISLNGVSSDMRVGGTNSAATVTAGGKWTFEGNCNFTGGLKVSGEDVATVSEIPSLDAFSDYSTVKSNASQGTSAWAKLLNTDGYSYDEIVDMAVQSEVDLSGVSNQGLKNAVTAYDRTSYISSFLDDVTSFLDDVEDALDNLKANGYTTESVRSSPSWSYSW